MCQLTGYEYNKTYWKLFFKYPIKGARKDLTGSSSFSGKSFILQQIVRGLLQNSQFTLEKGLGV
jgi:hypothetical protein